MPVVRKIVHLRWTQRLGPAQIARQVGLAPSTVHAILVRCRLIGHGFIHAAVDDHSRQAYAEIHPDETSQTAAGFLGRAQAWFAAGGVAIQRVLTDNRSCYRSQLWRATCQQLAITPKRTRPYRPQTNAKVERFNRTQVEGWAYRRL